MRKIIAVGVLIAGLMFMLQANAQLFGRKDPDEKRADLMQMREEVLARLYDEVPDAQRRIAISAGYAVFDNKGFNLLILSTANGKGIAHDNNSGKDIYMKMFSAGGGIGAGIKSFSGVFIFNTRNAFDNFIESGWDFSAQIDAAATTDSQNNRQAGSAEAVIGLNQEVEVFQMTDKGLALQATLQGTKYWKDDDLNN